VCLARGGGGLPRNKQTAETAPCIGDREVRGITVDVQYHVGGVLSNFGVQVGCYVIQHLIRGGLCLLHRLGLLRGNVIEWH
jgi:hypothetical protein